MYAINDNNMNEIIINKSKFICICKKVINEQEAINEIKKIKEDYKNATHYCYAYITDSVKRFNDDGEPNGTAGIPILNVLENNNLNYVLCIVIRYFGGIKLGAGGLVRAYSKSASQCIKKAGINKLIYGKRISIIFSYDKVKLIDNILKDIKIDDKSFNQNVSYIFNISNHQLAEIKEILKTNVTEFNISENILLKE